MRALSVTTSLKFSHYFRLEFRSYSSHHPRIAIVGSGPAGLFTCASLLRRSSAKCDVFDASPVPFGLVRYGVAPDHQEVKNCTHGFDKMFDTHTDRLSLYCNVRIGSDITFDELCSSYDSVLLAYGAHRPRQLNIPGANAVNVMSGSDFVSWYNGVPKAKDPLLDTPNAVVIGNGNVALDCARILATGAQEGSALRLTDVPMSFLDVLEKSQVDHIRVVGRRGPSNISFTVKELREQFKVPNWKTSVKLDSEEIDKLRSEIETMDRRRKRVMQLLVDGAKSLVVSASDKQCEFLFNRVPQEVNSDAQGRVSSITMLNKKTGKSEDIPCGLLIYSIGYETIVLDGVPKNDKGMIDMLDECRVRMPPSNSSCPANVYAAGWCAHGPKGVIGDTQQQALMVADEMVSDLNKKQCSSGDGVDDILRERSVSFVSWEDWKMMDAEEQTRGHEKGKVREKITIFDGYIKKK